MFVGTKENISNAQALLEYHVSYLQVCDIADLFLNMVENDPVLSFNPQASLYPELSVPFFFLRRASHIKARTEGGGWL